MKVLGKKKIKDLKRELERIINWMPSPMPEVKMDVDRLCLQAEIGRQYLRSQGITSLVVGGDPVQIKAAPSGKD